VPGEGDRWNDVKYDSPEFHGFAFSAAWGEDDFWDAALRYAGGHDGFKLAGGIGYSSWTGGGSLNDRGCAIALTAPASPNPPQFTGGDSNCQTLGLSGSILHEKTGLFLTGGYGIKWDQNRNASFQGVTEIQAVGGTGGNIKDSDDFYFVNAGIEKKFDEFGLKKLGRTTLYGEWEHYDTGGIIGANGLTATARPRTFTASSGFDNGTGGASRFGAGANIDVLGVGLNQNIEAASLDLYAAYRWSTAELYTSANGVKSGPQAITYEFEAIQLVMTGAVLKF
jgi:hypothetical protein